MKLKLDYPEVPWAQARGMRNLLAHEYFRVNVAEVWVTVKENFPQLKEQVSKILEQLKSPSALEPNRFLH